MDINTFIMQYFVTCCHFNAVYFCKKLYSVSYNKNKVNINSEFYDTSFIYKSKKKPSWEHLTVYGLVLTTMSVNFYYFWPFIHIFSSILAASTASFALIFSNGHNRKLLYRGDLFGACVRRHLAAWPDWVNRRNQLFTQWFTLSAATTMLTNRLLMREYPICSPEWYVCM